MKIGIARDAAWPSASGADTAVLARRIMCMFYEREDEVTYASK